MTHICAGNLTIIGSYNDQAPSHYLNQCCNIVKWASRNNIQWTANRKSYILIQENPIENVVWKMAAILSRLQCFKTNKLFDAKPLHEPYWPHVNYWPHLNWSQHLKHNTIYLSRKCAWKCRLQNLDHFIFPSSYHSIKVLINIAVSPKSLIASSSYVAIQWDYSERHHTMVYMYIIPCQEVLTVRAYPEIYSSKSSTLLGTIRFH